MQLDSAQASSTQHYTEENSNQIAQETCTLNSYCLSGQWTFSKSHRTLLLTLFSLQDQVKTTCPCRKPPPGTASYIHTPPSHHRGQNRKNTNSGLLEMRSWTSSARTSWELARKVSGVRGGGCRPTDQTNDWGPGGLLRSRWRRGRSGLRATGPVNTQSLLP